MWCDEVVGDGYNSSTTDVPHSVTSMSLLQPQMVIENVGLRHTAMELSGGPSERTDEQQHLASKPTQRFNHHEKIASKQKQEIQREAMRSDEKSAIGHGLIDESQTAEGVKEAPPILGTTSEPLHVGETRGGVYAVVPSGRRLQASPHQARSVVSGPSRGRTIAAASLKNPESDASTSNDQVPHTTTGESSLDITMNRREIPMIRRYQRRRRNYVCNPPTAKELEKLRRIGCQNHFTISEINAAKTVQVYPDKPIHYLLQCPAHDITRHARRNKNDTSLKCLECMAVKSYVNARRKDGQTKEGRSIDDQMPHQEPDQAAAKMDGVPSSPTTPRQCRASTLTLPTTPKKKRKSGRVEEGLPTGTHPTLERYGFDVAEASCKLEDSKFRKHEDSQVSSKSSSKVKNLAQTQFVVGNEQEKQSELKSDHKGFMTHEGPASDEIARHDAEIMTDTSFFEWAELNAWPPGTGSPSIRSFDDKDSYYAIFAPPSPLSSSTDARDQEPSGPQESIHLEPSLTATPSISPRPAAHAAKLASVHEDEHDLYEPQNSVIVSTDPGFSQLASTLPTSQSNQYGGVESLSRQQYGASRSASVVSAEGPSSHSWNELTVLYSQLVGRLDSMQGIVAEIHSMQQQARRDRGSTNATSRDDS